MEEKIYCNICDGLIYVNDIEDHITNSIHKDSKNHFIQQLNSVKINEYITNKSTICIWKIPKLEMSFKAFDIIYYQINCYSY